MAIMSILAISVFSTVICIVEIPKMLEQRLYRELWIFCILLGTGTVLAVFKSLDVEIPNPSDFIAWVFRRLQKP